MSKVANPKQIKLTTKIGKAIKNNKSNGIPMVTWKNLSGVKVVRLTDLFNKILQTKKMVDD